MSPQSRRNGESLLAKRTLVQFDLDDVVEAFVALQRPDRGEFLPADVALERLFVRVRSQVLIEDILPAESFLAQRTRKLLLFFVLQHVSRVVGLPVERLVADVTCEPILFEVRLFVTVQVLAAFVNFRADVTSEGLIRRVRFFAFGRFLVRF